MSLTRKIAHNTIIQTTGKVIGTLLGLVTVGFITRYLGKEGFGHYTTIIVFLQFFAIFVDMGLYLIVIKYITDPKLDPEHALWNIFTLRFFSAIALLGLAPIVVIFFPYPALVKWGVALTSLSFLFVLLNQALLGIFQKHLATYKPALAEVLGRLVLLGVTLAAIYTHQNILGLMSAVVASSFVTFITTFWFAKKYVRIRFMFDFAFWLKILRDTWPVALSIMFNLVYFKADTVILSLIKPAADVGIYGATFKVLEVLTTFPAMFAGIMTPLLNEAWAEQKLVDFKHYLQQGFNFLVMVSVPLIFGTLVLGRPVMILVSGAEFATAGSVLKVIIFATAAIFIGNLFGNTIVAVHKQRSMVKMYAIVAVVSLIGYLILIPRYSYYGAAVMTVVSEVSIMLAAMITVLRTTHIRLSYLIAFKAGGASLVMALILYLMRDIHVLILLPVAFVVYGLALYAFRGFTKATVREILRLPT